MPKVRVLGSVDEEAREALLKLLEESGCDLVDEDACGGPGAEDGGGDGDGQADSDEAEEPEAPAGDEPAHADDDGAAGDTEPPCDEEVGVIVLSPECRADEGLERVMQEAAARGCRVIGIWPPGTGDETLPRAFEDYGGYTVTWDAGRLRGALSSGNTGPGWLKPDARPRAERQTKRNKC